MKKIHNILAIVPLILLLASCAKDNRADMYWQGEDAAAYKAILTVKKTPTDTVYFQLDDSTTIYPQNYQSSFTRMEKLFCDIVVYNKPTGRFKYTGMVNWAEPIDEGTVTADATIRGDLGLDIVDDWMTGLEDGYLTLHYNTWWGLSPVRHSFYVITGTDPADPYTLVLMQKADGDKKDEQGDALICFDVNALPDTGGEYKELTLKWTSSGGTAAEKTFKFKSRE